MGGGGGEGWGYRCPQFCNRRGGVGGGGEGGLNRGWNCIEKRVVMDRICTEQVTRKEVGGRRGRIKFNKISNGEEIIEKS